MTRCSLRVYWWDLDMQSQCVRSDGHPGLHRDGTRWFNDLGYQQPQPEPWPVDIWRDGRAKIGGWKERAGLPRSRTGRKDFAA